MNDFEELSPDNVIDAVEQVMGKGFTGLAHSHPSYINRVYELQDVDGDRFVAKFYRPGRWEMDALLDEHDFIMDCVEDEIPVIPPLVIGESTLAEYKGIYFAVFPKKWGHTLQVEDDENWLRLGRIVGRCHMVGQRFEAEHRIIMDPSLSTKSDISTLQGFIDEKHLAQFNEITDELMSLICPLFEDVDRIRIHGDLHMNNILEHSEDGLMLIDFDDMAMGPAVQDLWLMLSSSVEESRQILDLLIDGYEEFYEFDHFSLKLIEPLRVMRMLYFSAWCSMQINDPVFRHNFPHWGTSDFWQVEINDLQKQLMTIKNSLR
ncbi:MAG: serine/threonine protein kinase [Lentisphaeria bacterium]|nr:serine/threonine protein kinase [Lentisphaeria bacterium]NQZ68556.1 serine/threonine protein kinase [Lentisphaeria bacterium]